VIHFSIVSYCQLLSTVLADCRLSFYHNFLAIVRNHSESLELGFVRRDFDWGSSISAHDHYWHPMRVANGDHWPYTSFVGHAVSGEVLSSVPLASVDVQKVLYHCTDNHAGQIKILVVMRSVGSSLCHS
jgi:hypothetical protein